MNNCVYCKEGYCTKSRTIGLRTFRPDGCHGNKCMLIDDRQETCGGYEDKPNMTEELAMTLAVLLAHRKCSHDGVCNTCKNAKQTLEQAVSV